ncbi:hypothetical protein [Paracoccus marinaquae]|uniref:Uncharacterized protein n=1 Tax=Paracoccus marinaquae TaxID=2841926 RepID=A0ABS6AP91_9RHOB|nr:hypothetical protein [Paracoccus marinaquae]MBU3032398.1 hypothetical protein [Paracoccus marinaquae]
MPQAHLNATDEIDDARHVLNLIELATRYNPGGGKPDPDRAAINAACFTALDKLDAAALLLETVSTQEGGAA